MARYLGYAGAILLLSSNAVLVAQVPPQEPEDYFTVVEGDVPIILTAGHGGTLSYPFPPRTCTGDEVCGGDANTRLLAPQASDAFYGLTGKRPYMIVAQGSRKYIDLNRDKTAVPNLAFEDPLAEPFYDYYHGTIEGFIDDVIGQYGRGLLLDIHGQSSIPDQVLRGTKNGLSTTQLLDDFGSPSLNGVNSIFGTLDALGYPVDPDVNIPFPSQVENSSYDGGYTIQAYGSHQTANVDSIQIEYGWDFRDGTAWVQSADDLAIAMNNFYEAYLVQAPGDVDRDGSVDGRDFLTWQRGVGTTSGATITDGDTNGDGQVDGDDLLVWQEHYGGVESAMAVGAAVPEPGGLALLLGGMLVLGGTRRRRPGAGARIPRVRAACRGKPRLAVLLASLASSLIATHAFAEVLTFTSRIAWETALSGTSTLEDFEAATHDILFGLAYEPTYSPNGELGLRANANYADNASIDVYPYISNGADIGGNVVVNMRFLDQGNNTNSQETVDVFLPGGMSAFAFDYNNYDSAGDGTFLSFTGTNGGVVSAFNSLVDGFFGVVDTQPGATITRFSFSGDPTTGSGSSAFNSFDNVRYGVADTGGAPSTIEVPEPASAGLMGAALTATIAVRRRKKAYAGLRRLRAKQAVALSSLKKNKH